MALPRFKAVLSALTLAAFVTSNATIASAITLPVSRAATNAPGAALTARAHGAVARKALAATAGTVLFRDAFGEAASTPGAWLAVDDACLTAGTATTPATSIPACGAAAPQDAAGAGALQLTPGTTNASGMVVYRTPVATAKGLSVSFTDASFHGSMPGADGITLFLADASKPIPTLIGNTGGSLGYAQGTSNISTTPVPGIANAYLGIALDEYGNFSNPNQGRIGGPGAVPETIAVRGSAATNYQYIGGALGPNGVASILPFSFDQPTVLTRPTNAPTITASLTAAGVLTVAVDRHDGNGSVSYYSQAIVGVNGQPALPANVYIGLTASTGGYFNYHQITGLSASTLTAAPAPPAPAPSGPTLQDPQQLRSSHGQLVFNVIATQTANRIPRLSYNGSIVPPTLRLLPGDTLLVNLTNNLPKPPAGAGYLNDTNLHYHGLHVSPNAPGDDSIDMMAMPGQTLHYQIPIPANHPSGLYWYHSHAHGEAERQNLSGMSGALIIDGISKYAPQVANLPERILIARDTIPVGGALPAADAKQVNAMLWAMRHGNVVDGSVRRTARTTIRMAMPGMGASHPMSMDSPVVGNTNAKTRNPYVVYNPKYRRFISPAASTHCLSGVTEAPSRTWTLNGQTRPSIGIRPGEQQFWRFVNSGSDTYLDLQVDNTTMQIVGLDGVPLASVGNAPMTVSHYLVPPASRIEFLLKGPPAGTTAYLRTNCFDSGTTGLAMPATTLATIDPTDSSSDLLQHRDRPIGGSASGNIPTPRHGATTAALEASTALGARSTAVHAGARLHTVAYIRNFIGTNAIARTQTLTYSDQDQINGQSYDPSGPAQFYAQSGTMERWQIVNQSSQVHTFHIHQIHFLVQSVVGGTPIEQSNVGQEIDNINVPAATPNGPGSVTLVMDFTDPSIIGTFLLHCHILSHEDMGMMAKIRVGKSPPLTTSAPPTGLAFASPTAPAQGITVTGGTAPFSLSGCANVVRASVAGRTITVAPAGGGNCVLIVADTTGLTASIAIAVTGKAAVISVAPTSLAFASATAAAQAATVAGGTPPYSISGCAGIAAASLAGATITVTPHAAGSCSLAIGDSAGNTQVLAISVNAVSTGHAMDNPTFHNNNARQGWNSSESLLSTANVAAGTFGKIDYLTGSGYGKVYAQPLFASNESIGGVAHNLVLVATATDKVFAYDDHTYALVWARSFTNPAAGITQQSWLDTGCKDVNPDVGIVGTPVIDRAMDRMFVVVPTDENGAQHLRLHAISLQNGADVAAPTEVSASVMLAGNTGTASTSPKWNFNRSALLEANGSIYVALGSHCDYQAATTHGWVMAYSAASLAPAGTVVDLTNGQSSGYLGSPWMAGYGPAADSFGNVYFATGNGPWDGVSAFSMSDLKLPGNLNIGSGSYFTPSNWANESNSDQDLGSGGVMLLPDGLSAAYPHLLVQGGKTGIKYLLNRDAMGGNRAGDSGALWQANVGGQVWGGPSFFQDASGKSYMIYGTGDPISTFVFNPTTLSFTNVANGYPAGNCLECRNQGSQTVVSSNGTAAGSTIAWAIQGPGGNGGNATLYAFNPLTMATLYSGLAGQWNPGANVGSIAGMMVSPLVANGRVYVPTDGGIAVFGLTSGAQDQTIKRGLSTNVRTSRTER